MSKSKKTSTFKRIFRFTFRLLAIMFITSLLYLLMCKWVMPPITITQLSNYIGGYGLNRSYVNYDDISPNLKLAALASEDQLFPDHGGFDWKALEKSLEIKEPESKKKSKKSKKKTWGGGASTISQQTAKNVFLWQGEGATRYVRKAPEFYFTKMIELVWGKKRILEVYLNVIETGPGVFGVEAASQKYFGKSAKNVSREEAAKIIACLPNPKKFTVKPESRWVTWKSQWILRQMRAIETDQDIKLLLK